MSSPKPWWRRATAKAKDHGSLYWSRVALRGRHHGSGYARSHDVEAAIIRATSHDDSCVDYKYAGRVFAWARASPSAFLRPLTWSLARRVSRTRSWVVALKSLLIAHGLLLCSDDAPPSARLGRLPFDLSDFKDRSSADAGGFSAFVRAYFRFLDRRSLYAAVKPLKGPAFMTPESSPEAAVDSSPPIQDADPDEDLHRLERLQILLDLLMQIRPYTNGMDIRLVLEAMDCVVIEIFEVYSGICNGIAEFLVGIFGSDRKVTDAGGEEARRRRGAIGMRILRRATVQSSQLSSYFEVCRDMGVLNATEFPPVERIPEEDIDDLEKLMLGVVPAVKAEPLAGGRSPRPAKEEKVSPVSPLTSPERKLETVVITKEWVRFDDDVVGQGHFGNPFLSAGELLAAPAPASWTGIVNGGGVPAALGDLIELI